MKYLVRLVAFSLLFMVMVSCGGSKQDTSDDTGSLDAPLSDEELEAISKIPRTSYSLDEIVLPNGKTVKEFIEQYGLQDLEDGSALSALAVQGGPQAQKNAIIAKMTTTANYLTDDTNFVYPEEAVQGGVLRPAQNGLAYSWGGKDYTIRGLPTGGSCRQAAVYGLDCSGFVYQLAKSAGLSIPVGNADTQSQPATWENAFKKAGFDKLKAEKLEQLPTSEFETGDIIYWYNAKGTINHIGVVLKTKKGNLAVYASNGSDSDKCAENYGKTRGPQEISLDHPYWFGKRKWGVTRFVTDISSDWQLSGRCQGRTVDGYKLTISLTADEQQNVTASGTGTDYDGSPLAVTMNGTYDQTTNTLTAKLNMTFPQKGGSRRDSFTHQLNEDDTGYFPATMEYNSAQGCQSEIRLINQTTAPLPTSIQVSPKVSEQGLFQE